MHSLFVFAAAAARTGSRARRQGREWRIRGGRPFAIIHGLRLLDGSRRGGSVLGVSRIGRNGSPGCLVGWIDGRARSANQAARNLDRSALQFRCGRDMAAAPGRSWKRNAPGAAATRRGLDGPINPQLVRRPPILSHSAAVRQMRFGSRDPVNSAFTQMRGPLCASAPPAAARAWVGRCSARLATT